MFFEKKQIFYRVADACRSQKKLWLFYAVWSVACIWYAENHMVSVYDIYQKKISVADMLLLMQSRFAFGQLQLPFAMLAVMKSKQKSMNIQMLLRSGKRETFFKGQAADSALYAAGIIVWLMSVQIVMALFFGLPLINWNHEESLFCEEAGYLVSGQFGFVILLVALMYFVKMMIDMTVLDILLWKPKYLVLVWVLIVLQMSVLEAEQDGIKIFHGLFSAQYKLWAFPEKHTAILMIGICAIVLLHLAGRWFIRKKDIFGGKGGWI